MVIGPWSLGREHGFPQTFLGGDGVRALFTFQTQLVSPE